MIIFFITKHFIQSRIENQKATDNENTNKKEGMSMN